jgi:hypothetical protein
VFQNETALKNDETVQINSGMYCDKNTACLGKILEGKDHF